MKQGTKVAIKRALKMMDYLESNEDCRMTPDLRLNRGSIRVNGYFKSHREVFKFKKEFEIKRFNKATFGGVMEYEIEERFVKVTLTIILGIKGHLPPTCQIVEKEIWVDEELVEGHYETRTEIVCDKPVETEKEKVSDEN